MLKILTPIVAGAVVLAGCGGGDNALPDRALTAGEGAVCTEVRGAIDTLRNLAYGPSNAALGLRSAPFRSEIGPLLKAGEDLTGESDSPLRQPMEKFRSAAQRVRSDYIDVDDAVRMAESLTSAQAVCQGMDPGRYLPRPRAVSFPGVRCPDGLATFDVSLDEGESGYAFGDAHEVEYTVGYGDLTGDGIEEVVGSFACTQQGEETLLGSVVVLTLSPSPSQLGQTVKTVDAYDAAAENGRLRILERDQGPDAPSYYRLVDGRWNPDRGGAAP